MAIGEIGGVEFEPWQQNIANAAKTIIECDQAYAVMDKRLFTAAFAFHEAEEKGHSYERTQQNRGLKTTLITAEVARAAMCSSFSSPRIDVTGAPIQLFQGDLAQIVIASAFDPNEDRLQKHGLLKKALYWSRDSTGAFFDIAKRSTYELPKAAQYLQGWDIVIGLRTDRFGSAIETCAATGYALSVAKNATSSPLKRIDT